VGNSPLLENAIVVAEAIAPGRVVQSGERVHVASSQATKASVTERCIYLRLDDFLHVEAELFDTL
jgi:hypothetical protein